MEEESQERRILDRKYPGQRPGDRKECGMLKKQEGADVADVR